MNAKNIMIWGISIGCGVFAESLKNHKFKKRIQYLSVKEQTFHKLSQVPNRWCPKHLPVASKVIKLLKWELNAFSHSSLPCPEIIIQKATCLYPNHPDQILDDGMIEPENSLGGFILQKEVKNKAVIGVGSNHCRLHTQEEYSHIVEDIKKHFEHLH